MDLFGIGSIVSGVTGLIGTVIGSSLNYVSQDKTNKVNQQINSDNLEFTDKWNNINRDDAWLQYNTNRDDAWKMYNMNRSDAYNSVSIRAQDLKNAGLSKNLAAGSGAQQTQAVQAGSVQPSTHGAPSAIPMQAPQLMGLEKLSLVGDAVKGIAQGQNLKAETDYKKAQAIIEMKREGLISSEEARNYAQSAYWNAISQPTVSNINADTRDKNASASAKEHDVDLAKKTGTKSTEKVTPANKFEAVYRTAAMAKYFIENVGTRSQLTSDAQSAQQQGVDFETWYDSLPPKQREAYSKSELSKIFKNAGAYSTVKETSKPGVKHRGNQLNY